MESQPQNSGFRIHPENFHPCVHKCTDFIFCAFLVIKDFNQFLGGGGGGTGNS